MLPGYSKVQLEMYHLEQIPSWLDYRQQYRVWLFHCLLRLH